MKRRGRAGTILVLLGTLGAPSCRFLPDEFNLSPLFRQRYAPDGTLAELDVLWPLVHYQADETGFTDARVRPVWRRFADGAGERKTHEFLVPLGWARFDREEDFFSLIPVVWYRNHQEYGDQGRWDIDWRFLFLLMGGSSSDGEDYLALFPVYGDVPQLLTYDRLGWVMWPLHMWTVKGDTEGMHFLWPLIGWGGAQDPERPHWWRFLPFYAESIHPGKWESYSVLWPFFHWGADRLDHPYPYSRFFFWPIVGWRTGGAFLSWTFLWPFFRHEHKVDGPAAEGEPGDYVLWDFPWPIFRWLVDTWSPRQIDQWWLTPFVAETHTTEQDSLVLLYPFIWLRRTWDRLQDRVDTFVLPFFWRNRIRYKKDVVAGKIDDPDAFEALEDYHVRVWPLADWRETREGSFRLRALDPWPFDGEWARGVREAYDFLWTLYEREGDLRGNTRVRTFANVWTSRNFAGQRYQCSVPLLFSYEATASGQHTLRLLQILPITWGGATPATR